MADAVLKPLRVWELQEHITLDTVPDGQYICCRGCNDFMHLPETMDYAVWFDRVQDFTFDHDLCERRWKEKQHGS